MMRAQLFVMMMVVTLSGCRRCGGVRPPDAPLAYRPIDVVAEPPKPTVPPLLRHDPDTPTATPGPQPPAMPERTLKERLDEINELLKDAFFDYDQHILRPDAREALSQNSRVLHDLFTDFPEVVFAIEGHCDERGSAEYNLALGDLRAQAAREFLEQLGVPALRLRPISYGRERPQCVALSEECWQRNRRVHLAP